MGLLGVNIPTAAELQAAGIALEDHGVVQGKALIDYARQQLVDPILAAVAALPGDAAGLLAGLIVKADQVLGARIATLDGFTMSTKAVEVTAALPKPLEEKGN